MKIEIEHERMALDEWSEASTEPFDDETMSETTFNLNESMLRQPFEASTSTANTSTTETAPISCPVCKSYFKNKRSLQAHISHRHKRGRNSGKHKCPECGLKYSSKHNVIRHRQMAHNVQHDTIEEEKLQEKPQEKGPYICCSREFSTGAAFSSHQRMHLGRQSAMLSTAASTPTLQLDDGDSGVATRKQTETVRPSSTARSDISNNSHSSAELWTTRGSVHKCLHCDTTFESRKELNKHVDIKHSINATSPKDASSSVQSQPPPPVPAPIELQISGDKKFQCPYCKRRFTKACFVTGHIKRRHTNRNDPFFRPHRCPKCPLNYTQICNLRRHFLKQHGMRLTEYQQQKVGEQPATDSGLVVKLKLTPTIQKSLNDTLPPDGQIFRCCGRKFLTRHSLKIHRGMLHKKSAPNKKESTPSTKQSPVLQLLPSTQQAPTVSIPSSSQQHTTSTPLPLIDCKSCNEKFDSIISWTKHLLDKHPNEDQKMNVCKAEQSPSVAVQRAIKEEHQKLQVNLLTPRIVLNRLEDLPPPPAIIINNASLPSSVKQKLPESKLLVKKQFKATAKQNSIKKLTEMVTNKPKSAINPLAPGSTAKKPICRGCGQRFSNYSSVYRHYTSVHTIKKKISCKMCGGQFRHKRDLELHTIKAHENLEDDEEEIIYL